MTLTLIASIQHGNLESDEFGELSPDDAFARLTGHDWGEDLRLFLERKLTGEESCPPGFYLYRPSKEYLACYPASEGRFLLDFSVAHGRNLAGRTKQKKITLAPLPPAEVRELIEIFAAGTPGEIWNILSEREIVAGGLVI